MRFAPREPALAVESVVSRRFAAFLGIACAGVAFRIVLSLYIRPLTDVYYYDSQAVTTLLGGMNPYGHLYTGIPPALATPGFEAAFAYLPGLLLFLVPLAPFDVRVALVAAEILVAWAIYSLSGRWSLLASAVFILIPSGALFSVVYPNNTLPAMAFLGLGVTLENRGRRTPGAALIGAGVASSLFVLLAFPFFAAMWVRRKRWKEVATSLATAVAMVAPFLAWNPASFLQDTIFLELSRPAYQLVSNAPWGLNLNPTLSGIAVTLTGSPVPSVVRILIVLAMFVLIVGRASDLKPVLLRTGLFLAAAMFILPGDFFWVYLELPFQVVLMSLALGPMKQTSDTLNA